MSYVQLALGSTAARSSSRGASQGGGGSRTSRPSSCAVQKSGACQAVTEKPALAQAPFVAPSSPSSSEVSYAQLASSSRTSRGSSRGLQRRSGGSRAARLSAQASALVVGQEAEALQALQGIAPAQQTTHSDEMSHRSHWEEFVMHRHDTRLKLEALLEAREQQKIAEARGRLEVEELDDKFELCLEDLQAVCKQFGAFEDRLALFDRDLANEHKGLETMRQRLQDYSKELKDGFSRLDLSLHTQHEAVATAIKRGDRAVADELLLKMSELNEKLGRNMQALEDEVSRDLHGMAVRMEKTLNLVSSTVANDAPTAELETARADARQATAATMDARNAMQGLREEMLKGFASSQATHDDLAAVLRGSLDSMREEMHGHLTKASDQARSSLHEELCSRLEEARSAREALASAVQDSLRDMRDELSSSPPELHSLVNEAIGSVQESLCQVREDLRKGLGEAHEARRESATLAESATQGVDGIRTEMHAGLEEVQGICTSLASAAEKAVCGARHELGERIDRVHGATEELASKVSEVMASKRSELDEESLCNIQESVSNIRDEFTQGLHEVKRTHVDFAARVDEEIGRFTFELKAGLSGEQASHAELAESVDTALSGFRSELAEGFGEVREAQQATASACEELQRELELMRADHARELELVRADHGSLKAEVDGAVRGMQTELGAVRAAALTRKELTAVPDSAGHGMREEWRVDVEVRQATTCRTASHEIATFPDGAALHDASKEQCCSCRALCEEIRDETGAATEKLKSRMRDFYEEMLEMMESHEQQACGGCVEVQQGLEAAAARVAGLEDELRGQCVDACDSIRGDVARLERDLGENGGRLETLSGVIGKMRAQFDMLEPRLEAVSRAAHNTSSTSSPIRLERHLEGSAYELITSPTTLSETHGQIATLEERLEVLELAARDKSLEAIQEQFEIRSKSADGFPTAVADMQAKLDSVEGQLSVLRQALATSKSQLEHNLEAQRSDLAATHRAVAELTNDVLKAQGGADAAYAEATRQQDCSTAVRAAVDSFRSEWNTELAECAATARESIASVADEVLQQCRVLIDEAVSNLETSRPDETAHNAEKQQGKAYASRESHLQEELENAARVQAQSQEEQRCELERMREELREEVERIWEAIGGQAAGVTERCETLTLETQRQCRTWVDGALRKLEELALRTKERLSAFASERRTLAAEHEEAVSKAAAEAAEAAAAEVTDSLEKRLGTEIRRLLAAERHLMAERLIAPEAVEHKDSAPHTGSTLASSSSPQCEAISRQTPSGDSSSPAPRPQTAWLSRSGEPRSAGRSPMPASPGSSSKASPRLRQPVFMQPATALLHTPPDAKSCSTSSACHQAAEVVESDGTAEESPAPHPRARVAPLAAG